MNLIVTCSYIYSQWNLRKGKQKLSLLKAQPISLSRKEYEEFSLSDSTGDGLFCNCGTNLIKSWCLKNWLIIDINRNPYSFCCSSRSNSNSFRKFHWFEKLHGTNNGIVTICYLIWRALGLHYKNNKIISWLVRHTWGPLNLSTLIICQNTIIILLWLIGKILQCFQ